jgi:hypothetical protein
LVSRPSCDGNGPDKPLKAAPRYVSWTKFPMLEGRLPPKLMLLMETSVTRLAPLTAPHVTPHHVLVPEPQGL